MKKLPVILITVMAILALAFTVVTNKGAAIAQQQQGVFIFMYSHPAEPYDYLGTVEASGWVEDQKDQMNSIFKRLKKKYPDADGIIFHSDEPTKIDAIKFK